MSTKVKNNLLYNYYPFFLDNKFGIGDIHYLYQLVSPTYNKKICTPYFSLIKVSERNNYFTSSLPLEKDSDILTVCKNGMDNIRKGEINSSFDKVEFVRNLFRDDQEVVIENSESDKFPNIELKEDPNNELQKYLIVGLRNYLRWKNYKLFIGKKVDILITKTEFIIAEIKGDSNSVWLEPIALYKNKDVGMIEPLDMSGFNVEGFKNFARWKTDVKPGDISKIINKIELESFDRKSIIK